MQYVQYYLQRKLMNPVLQPLRFMEDNENGFVNDFCVATSVIFLVGNSWYLFSESYVSLNIFFSF